MPPRYVGLQVTGLYKGMSEAKEVTDDALADDSNDATPASLRPYELSERQRKAAADWISTKWTNSLCPFHGPTTWELSAILTQSVAFLPSGFAVGGPVFPLIVITCRTCGYTVFVNALKAGVLSPRAEVTE